MTGPPVSQTAQPNPNGRQALLARLQGLQRTLRNLRACGCPDDCRGHGNAPPSTPPNNNNGGGGNGGGGNGGGGNGGGGFLPHQVSHRATARVNSTVLARASYTKPANILGDLKDSPMRMSLQVHGDPQGNQTRMGYYAEFFLTPHGLAERYIGFISAWRLSKPPGHVTGQVPEPWVQEWLSGGVGGQNDDSRPFKETLRLLYDNTGQLRPTDVNDDNTMAQTRLGDTGNELVFIEMIWIKHRDATTGQQVRLLDYMRHTRSPRDRKLINGSLAVQYSRQRIAPQAIGMLYQLMICGTLPAWCHIDQPVTLVLRAGMPSDDGLCEMWFDKYPRGPDENARQYSDRIGDSIENLFRAVRRYGFIDISSTHRVLVMTIDYDQDKSGTSLEQNVVPMEPAPRPMVSTLRS
ncbi:hypothetical protein Daus18300_003419 [Diaporthe australafricana]|uniref:Uncharacterized protein n=1 Tax=Diaporthe australafricana TaxID=127596 RepID=A0ABR3XFY8_9PEZI